jgi:hypothetical protein
MENTVKLCAHLRPNQLIAQKNKAAEAMNGDATSDGLNAMLGDTGDLQTLLIQNIKSGNQLKGSTEEWTQANIGRI